jgi:asparaginyl-tRNA synthetase
LIAATIGRPVSRISAIATRSAVDDAIAKLKTKGFAVNWGDDLGGDEETAVSEDFDRPVMIHRYPSQSKAFYMKQDPARPEVALCVDMLAPEGHGEIIGGGQREDDYETLRSKILAHDLPLEPFEWYLDLRRYGSVPHAGFGLGFERIIQFITGMQNIRDVIPFPRTPNNAEF